MASYRWTLRAQKHLAAAIAYTEKKHPPDWTERLKDAVKRLEDTVVANGLIPKRTGRVKGTQEIDLTPLPYFMSVRIRPNGDYDFLALLHKRRKYP